MRTEFAFTPADAMLDHTLASMQSSIRRRGSVWRKRRAHRVPSGRCTAHSVMPLRSPASGPDGSDASFSCVGMCASEWDLESLFGVIRRESEQSVAACMPLLTHGT